MRKLLIVKFALFIVILFSISSCGIDEELDDIITECDALENQITPTDRVFQNMVCVLSWKDGTPAENLTVKMQIHKVYCEGNTAGFYEAYSPNNLTLSNGWWYSNYTATYTYKNKKDRVLLKFIVAPGGHNWVYDFVYRWEDVDEPSELNYGYIIPPNVYITLPINEDGS